MVKYCSDKTRAKTHVRLGVFLVSNSWFNLTCNPPHLQPKTRNHHSLRRDKYEPKIKEYWVDVETNGSFEKEDEEQFIDSTVAEGFADSISLGLPAMEPAQPEECDAESGGEDSGTEAPSVRVPNQIDVQKEHVIEARHKYDLNLPFNHFSTLYSNMFCSSAVCGRLLRVSMTWSAIFLGYRVEWIPFVQSSRRSRPQKLLSCLI